MKKNIYLKISILTILLSTFSFAQSQNRITGLVLDKSDRTPLPGASVVVKGTANGTITQPNGTFELTIKDKPIKEAYLVFSFVGMKSKTIKVGDKRYFKVYLSEDANELEQIVVTSSYGTRRIKEEVVGSISSLRAKDIQTTQAFESIDKMLDGQITGVNIETGASVLSPVSIDIRGKGSLSPVTNALLGTSTQPLIIIDNVIMSEETGIDNQYFDGSGTYAEDFLNPLAQIAIEDIESINVLKDAAAVSIYGADGANGVIIITTKKGNAGNLKFNFSSQVGISHAINQIKYLNGEQYTELRNEYLKNTGQATIPYNGVNTNWFGLLNENGFFNKYSFNVSGGRKAFSFRTGVNYLRIKEAQKGNGSNQYRMSMRFGYSKGRVHTNLSLNPSFMVKESPNIFFSYAFAPTLSPYNEDGSFAKTGVIGLGNPLASIEQNRSRTETFGTLGSIDTRINITDDLDFYSSFGLDYKDKNQDRYFSGANESGQYNGTFELNGEEYPAWGRRLINQRNTLRWNGQAQLSYTKQINDNHYFDGLAGIELAEEKVDFSYKSGRGFVNPEIIHEVDEAIQDDDPSTESDETNDNQNFNSDINYNSRVSLFAQFNYDFQKKYFILANFRRDQSSVFGDDTDVAYNSGAGLSWIISKEAFLSDVVWLDFLRLRLSYGTTGNSRIGSYRSKGLYRFDDVGGYNGLPYAIPSSAPNTMLTWETNKKFNVGIDFNFLERFNIVAEYFYDNLQDLITIRSIPSETGHTSVQINGSDMFNRGVELSLNVKLINTAKVKWNMRVNAATLESEVTDIVGLGDAFSISERALALKVGHSTSTLWGVKWAGVDPATGRNLIEKDGQIYDAITYKMLFDNNDWEPIGNTQPDVYGGFSTNLTINKRLSLNISGSYKYGAQKLIEDDLITNYNITVNRNLSVNAYDYWRKPGDLALNPAVTNSNPIIPNLSRYLYDTSNLKISNISLGYKVNTEKIKKYISELSFNFDVSNVFYFYKDKSPEGKNGIREFMYKYPMSRTYSFGLKLSF